MPKLSKYNLISLFLFLASSCVTNDFQPEYQKEVKYDGYNGAFDTITIKTYVAKENEILTKDNPFSEITKWYDINGYNSMTESVAYIGNKQRKITEQITRDKYSLAVARNIVIESPDTEPLVTLARLKKRTNGQEEWLYRHYLDPKKYLEDASTIVYTEIERITKKKLATIDTLCTIECDIFNEEGKLISKQAFDNEMQSSLIQTFYNSEGLADSIVTTEYDMIDSEHRVKSKSTESYRYEFNEFSNISRKHIYINDSTAYISEYKYSSRE